MFLFFIYGSSQELEMEIEYKTRQLTDKLSKDRSEKHCSVVKCKLSSGHQNPFSFRRYFEKVKFMKSRLLN
jgi:hypothetical protein